MPLRSLLSDPGTFVRLTTVVDPRSRLIPTTGMIPQNVSKNMASFHNRANCPDVTS